MEISKQTVSEALLPRDLGEMRCVHAICDVNCVHLISAPLTKICNNVSRTGPFLMFLGALESYRQSASYAFGFIKKYLCFEKLEPKTFVCIFFITRFSEEKNIFFEKLTKTFFQKMWASRKKIKV